LPTGNIFDASLSMMQRVSGNKGNKYGVYIKTAPWEDGTVSKQPKHDLGGKYRSVYVSRLTRFFLNSGGIKGGEMPPPMQALKGGEITPDF
jgi:hypothetical protein